MGEAQLAINESLVQAVLWDQSAMLYRCYHNDCCCCNRAKESASCTGSVSQDPDPMIMVARIIKTVVNRVIYCSLQESWNPVQALERLKQQSSRWVCKQALLGSVCNAAFAQLLL